MGIIAARLREKYSETSGLAPQFSIKSIDAVCVYGSPFETEVRRPQLSAALIDRDRGGGKKRERGMACTMGHGEGGKNWRGVWGKNRSEDKGERDRKRRNQRIKEGRLAVSVSRHCARERERERERERRRAGGKTNYVIYKRRRREQQRVARNGCFGSDGLEYRASEFEFSRLLVLLQIETIVSSSLMYLNYYYIILLLIII